MSAKLLFVDDEPNVLAALRRTVGSKWQTETAQSGPAALDLIQRNGPYAVVLADMRMPGMSGLEVLKLVATIAPNTSRVMLTGNVDQKTAVDAVNQGSVFRYLNKPCDDEVLMATLDAAVSQNELATARQELIEKTLAGSVKLLSDVLAYVDPAIFGESKELLARAKLLCSRANYKDAWQIEIAAMLSKVGIVSLPPSLAAKARMGQELREAEKELLSKVPQVGHDLLAQIPYLQPVAEIVLHQDARFNGSGYLGDKTRGDSLPFGARVLFILKEMGALEAELGDLNLALKTMATRRGWYDPQILDDAERVFGTNISQLPHGVVASAARCLRVGNIPAHDIKTKDGRTIVPAGKSVSWVDLQKVTELLPLALVDEPIYLYEDQAA
ncbi:MAG TPA: HD domain-containing phosphohydrolase [Fimbriimonas sp.]|nr:HD domain-containing phosphohydrolase [Fimbriimonas sp.]